MEQMQINGLFLGMVNLEINVFFERTLLNKKS